MRFKVEVFLAFGFGGASVLGLIVPVLGYSCLAIAVILGVDILVNWRGYRMKIRLPISFERKTKNGDKGASETSLRISSKTQRYADWMTAALNHDLGDFQGCIKVDSEPHIEWHGLLGTDSHIEFRFSVSSSSVYTLKIVKYMDGHLKYQGEEVEKLPEITSSIKELKRSDSKNLKIKQWFSSSMMNRIALDGGEKITFRFNGVNILVEGKYPDGSDGPTCRLPLPDVVTRIMPTKRELEH